MATPIPQGAPGAPANLNSDAHQADKKRQPDRSEKEREVCKKSFARVQWFSDAGESKSRSISVEDLVYGKKLNELESIQDGSGKIDDDAKWRSEAMRWIQLPANNKKWALDLIPKLRISSKNDPKVDKTTEIRRNIKDHFNEFSALDPAQKSFRHSQFQIQPMLDMVLPYLDMESEEQFSQFKSQKSESQQVYAGSGNLHVAQTLDESYYSSSESIELRNTDQIVLKSTRQDLKRWKLRSHDIQGSHPRLGQVDNGPVPALLMVRQLWLWRVDERTIITAFSDREHQETFITGFSNQGTPKENLFGVHTLLENLIQATTEVRSINELVARITLHCITHLDGKYKAGLRQSVFHTFSTYISQVSDEVTQFRNKFIRSLSLPGSQSTHEIMGEVRCLKEIDDARDEIHMIRTILDEQREVVEQIRVTLKRESLPLHGDSWRVLLDDRSILTYRRRMEQLDEDAKRVEKSLTTLLDLKQKQANIDEAVSASNQAKATATQGYILMIFTVITVVFTPLSFMASLFALPITNQFPQSSNGMSINGNDYSRGYIGGWMTLGELATIVTILLVYIIMRILQRWLLKPQTKDDTGISKEPNGESDPSAKEGEMDRPVKDPTNPFKIFLRWICCKSSVNGDAGPPQEANRKPVRLPKKEDVEEKAKFGASMSRSSSSRADDRDFAHFARKSIPTKTGARSFLGLSRGISEQSRSKDGNV